MVTTRSLCAAGKAGLLLALLLLVGCAGSSSRPDQAPDDYFARQMPGLPHGWDPMMSPADTPRYLGSIDGSPPERLRLALLDQHERWAGTPYRLGGSTQRGIDCSALVQRVFAEAFRLELPRTTGRQVQEGDPVARDALEVGDLVFFRPPGAYDHVGIYVGEGFFLHASTSQGVTLSRLDNAYWRRHYWQARRTLAPTLLAQRVPFSDEG
ncbi:NlpC/P60 family protein [Halomonas sp. NO4]|uniref:NlpC/P60 family protein n=1 Tax=Halomonas sp. NO4 TaxID=2484813 RepID=UPI0013D384CE|nr:NlpC/P60 family protein [Halomonas sp. NO4]